MGPKDFTDPRFTGENEEETSAKLVEFQALINAAESLTAEKAAKKEEMEAHLFVSWSMRDFQQIHSGNREARLQ